MHKEDYEGNLRRIVDKIIVLSQSENPRTVENAYVKQNQ